MILRQIADDKCMWMDMCTINPCLIAFVALNCHSSQPAGSGDHSALAQPRDIEAAVIGGKDGQLQQHIRTIHGRKALANGSLFP